MQRLLLLGATDSEPVVTLTTRSRVIAIVIALLFLLLVLDLIRRHRLQEQYTVFWFVLALGLLAGAAFPQLLEVAGNVMGVRDANVALVLLFALVLLAISFSATLSISGQSERITRLAQENALLKLRLDKREGKLDIKPDAAPDDHNERVTRG